MMLPPISRATILPSVTRSSMASGHRKAVPSTFSGLLVKRLGSGFACFSARDFKGLQGAFVPAPLSVPKDEENCENCRSKLPLRVAGTFRHKKTCGERRAQPRDRGERGGRSRGISSVLGASSLEPSVALGAADAIGRHLGRRHDRDLLQPTPDG
jgi:hypothetical protein